MFINIKDFQQTNNTTSAWKNAFCEALACQAEGVYFPSGIYHFHAEDTVKRYCFTTNNDEGERHIVFDLRNLQNFTLCGEDALFIFHGRLTPVVAERCTNVTLRGFRVDYDCSFVSDAKIVSVEADHTDIELAGQYWLEAGTLRFFDDSYDRMERLLRVMRYDPVRREMLPDAKDLYLENSKIVMLADGNIRLPQAIGRCGEMLALKHQGRLAPAISFSSCRNVSVDHVTVHHSCGMALVAQGCDDVSLHQFNVTPRERLVSASDDAVHMTDCRGRLRIEGCTWENQWDDAVNVHGIYRKLRRRDVFESTFLFLETGHFQQFGVETARVGDTLEFIKRDTMKPCGQAEITFLRQLNKQMTEIRLDRIPSEVADGDGVRSLAPAQATLEVRNCRASRNKPRGILISGIGSALVEKCYFHTAGAAIYVSGDANFWYESGPLPQLTVRDNFFDNCNFMTAATGRTPVVISPEIPSLEDDFHYHGTFEIYGNKHKGSTPALVSCRSVAQIVCHDNEYIHDSSYPAANSYEDTVVTL